MLDGGLEDRRLPSLEIDKICGLQAPFDFGVSGERARA
jgi:hypothetical protein